jgi:hypothetical protein
MGCKVKKKWDDIPNRMVQVLNGQHKDDAIREVFNEVVMDHLYTAVSFLNAGDADGLESFLTLHHQVDGAVTLAAIIVKTANIIDLVSGVFLQPLQEPLPSFLSHRRLIQRGG